MIFYVLNSDEKLVETIQSPDESGVAGITAIQGVVEEKLSTYELIELIVPADSDGLEEIEEEMTIIFKDISGWREYIIYEIEDIDGDSLETTIRAELSSSELIDEVIERDIRGISNNPERNLEEILEGTRWLAGQVDTSLYSQPLNVDTNYMNVLEVLNEYATIYGAEIRFRYEVDGNKVVRRYVDAYKQFGEYKGKIFEIDRDMTSVKRTVNTELIKTTIIPYSKELEKEYPEGEEPETKETYRIGIEDIEWKKSNGDPADKPLGQNYLVDPVALDRWGKLNADGSRRHKKVPMEFDFDNAEAIISMAWVQLGRYTQPRVSYEVSAIDLYAMTGDEDLKHEQILLGDTGGVKDHYFSNPLEIQTRLVEVKRDLFDPRNNDYVFGDPRTIFSANASVERAEEMAKDMEDVITRIENAQISIDGKTKVFRGSEVPVNPEENDIWFRPHPSKQGHTQMMLFNGATWEIHVDSSDLEDAGRLTFGTIDGAEINVINLIADNITGGQLKLENGIEITHKGIPILRVNNSGEVEMNISKMTINAIDFEEELARIHGDIENIELEKGDDGKSAYDIAVENGFQGTEQEWIHSLVGEEGNDGKTAYDIAVEEGFKGTETEWLNSLKGDKGETGDDGKGILSQVTTYQNHTNGTTEPTGNWSPTPSPIKGQYMWTRTITTYTIGKPVTTYSVAYNALDGQRGTDGTGIDSTEIRYFQSTSGTTLPSGEGSKTPLPPIKGEYNWTRTVITYTDETSSTAWSTSYNALDGQSQYVHIRYSANSNGSSMTDKPVTTTKYIGIAITNSSTAPGNTGFTWSKYIGEDGSPGQPGLPGAPGENGKPTYTWIKYADDDKGLNMDDFPEGKKYIGLSFNNDDMKESTDWQEYQWSLMPQNIEIGGVNRALEPVEIGYNLGSGLVSNNAYRTFTTAVLPVGKYIISHNTGMGVRLEPSANVSTGSGYSFTEPLRIEVTTESSFNVSMRKPDTSDLGDEYLTLEEMRFMIEKGNTATDWTEAPEDTQAKLDDKAGTDALDEVKDSLNDWETIVAKKEELGEIIIAMNDIADGIKAEGEVSEEISKKVENILERVPVIEENLKDRSVQWNFIDSYISFSGDGMLIKDSDGSAGILINEKEIAFIDSDNKPVADITSDRMRINRGIFVDSVRVGQHEEYDQGDGHTITVWIGDVNNEE